MALRRLQKKKDASQCIDIQLDRDHVVFNGSAIEALAVYLSGNLAVRVKDWRLITDIRLHLRAAKQTLHPTRSSRKRSSNESEIYKRTWNFDVPAQCETANSMRDEFSFPFHVVLLGSLPETVQGLNDVSLNYTFTAEVVSRRGKTIIFQKPLRVIRVPEALNTDQVLDDMWKEKIAYRFHVPNRLVAFGTSMDFEYTFAPLMKGLKIEWVESQVLENREALGDHGPGRNVPTTKIISTDRYRFDEDETSMGGEYRSCRSINLPLSLGSCVQDVDVMGISVTHKLRVIVRMQNPDGHYSELRLSVPVMIYLSPAWPVWHDSSIATTRERPVTINCSDEAPPAYGKHELDKLCDVAQLV